MGIIAPTLPTIGAPRGSEEVDVRNALSALLGLVNGDLDLANLSSALQALLVPTGVVAGTLGTVAPTGWLLIQGQAVTATHATLRQYLIAGGSPHGTDGSGDPLLPDFRGRALYGLGTHTDVNSLADNDGRAVASRTPKHDHDGSFKTAADAASVHITAPDTSLGFGAYGVVNWIVKV